MKTIAFIFQLCVAGMLLFGCAEKESPALQPEPAADSGELTREDPVKRGEYLVEIMGCNDCHSPKIMTPQGPAPDPKRLLSGHPSEEQVAPVADKSILKDYALFNMSLTAATGPWGTSFAANLTPDDTGLGTWTFEQFEKAIREGRFKGMDNGRPLLPPMPWFNYAKLTNDDLTAVWAYLQSIPPVKNAVPANIPPAN